MKTSKIMTKEEVIALQHAAVMNHSLVGTGQLPICAGKTVKTQREWANKRERELYLQIAEGVDQDRLASEFPMVNDILERWGYVD